MDTDIKTYDIYKGIAEDVVIGLRKDELGAENHEKICWIKNKNL